MGEKGREREGGEGDRKRERETDRHQLCDTVTQALGLWHTTPEILGLFWSGVPFAC